MRALLSGGGIWGGSRKSSLAEGWPQNMVGTRASPGTKVRNSMQMQGWEAGQKSSRVDWPVAEGKEGLD